MICNTRLASASPEMRPQVLDKSAGEGSAAALGWGERSQILESSKKISHHVKMRIKFRKLMT